MGSSGSCWQLLLLSGCDVVAVVVSGDIGSDGVATELSGHTKHHRLESIELSMIIFYSTLISSLVEMVLTYVTNNVILQTSSTWCIICSSQVVISTQCPPTL